MPAPQSRNGTRFVVSIVSGPPSASSICSTLPWLAVTMAMPPICSVASTTAPTAASAASTAATALSKSPVCPAAEQPSRYSRSASYSPESTRLTHCSASSVPVPVSPTLSRNAPSPFSGGGCGNAASASGSAAPQSALHTSFTGKRSRWKPPNAGSTSARASGSTRSARKLKKITLSLSEIIPSRSQTMGSMRSSNTPSR